jgi:hypothetical protein
MTSDEFCDHIHTDRDMISASHVLTYGPGNALYIEDKDEQGRYYLILGRCDWFTGDLEMLEDKLYDYGADEGYFERSETVEDLIEIYTKWTVKTGHPQLSADELQYELLIQRDKLVEDIEWLQNFIERWENAQ